ncbi:MAG TPA: ABC transporter permease subunit, partial [Firmicutes bacterium]|nr:ABC transporter permease subunit [Bacillota bacterium]
LGNTMSSIIATALLTSVVVTILSVLTGFLSVDPEKQKLILTFGGTKRQMFFAVVLPSSVPAIVNALKINVGLSFVGVMVGEFLVSKAGLGYLITYGSQIFKLDWVMLSVVILAILSALLYRIILLLEKQILRWRE